MYHRNCFVDASSHLVRTICPKCEMQKNTPFMVLWGLGKKGVHIIQSLHFETHRSLPELTHLTWCCKIGICETLLPRSIFWQIYCIVEYFHLSVCLNCFSSVVLTKESCYFAFLFEEPTNPVFSRQWKWYPWMCGAKEIRNRSFCRSSSCFSQLLPSTWLKFSVARREGPSMSRKGNMSGETTNVAVAWGRQNLEFRVGE